MSAPATAPALNYKDTVLLPKTDFAMKADLVTREPVRLAKWESSKLWDKIQAQRKGSPPFILHDGPPFANGDVHMGTALNKVLKDLVVKSKTMAGFYTPFVPGWDCHGLPIEFKVVKEAQDLAPAEVRTRSEAYARKFIDIQRTSFKRLGVFGDWEKPYLTLDPTYEADIMRTFAKFVAKGLVYRSQRPVLWSFGAQTALAEAEVEYKEKTSPAVFVKFDLISPPPSLDGAALVIWTTTPWTLPANLGIALHPEFDYTCGTFTHSSGATSKLVIATSRIDAFTAATGYALTETTNEKIKGSELNGASAQHPFLPRASKVINALFVTNDTGTGAVHMAPGHGADDYIAGKAHGMDILSPVDDRGCYTADCGLPDFVGRHVFKSNEGIIEILAERGALLGNEPHVHQYPHCWRSKTPIIFRAVPQFFIRIDDIRQQALNEIDKVQWIPAWGRNRIYGTVESRPDWCISRQRTWGVPLPVFFSADGEAILDQDIIQRVANAVETHGSNLWFEKDDAFWSDLVGLPTGCTRCKDTLDVWIDSGCSSVAVMDRHPELHAPADLYIEATDQHRGWFQSSLMVSVVARGGAPYKSVITHGFVVDTTGKKISKSDQGTNKNAKPMTADHYYNKYGADMVRLWVSSVDFQTEVPFSQELFEQTGESYRRIRNTMRVILGNLHDFKPEHAVKAQAMGIVDRWIMERLHRLTKDSVEAYERYDFRKVFTLINQFCAVDLSAHYIDITKDRMYCDAANSQRRRAAQTAFRSIAETLCRLLAPILAFTADEAWEHLGNTESVHLESFPQADPDHVGSDATLAVEEMLQVRSTIQQAIEKARQDKRIGSSLEATVRLVLPSKYSHQVFSDPDTLHEFFILSDLKIERGDSLSAEVGESTHGKCARCWKHLAEVGSHADHPTLCNRCHEAVV
jgi:isoleucyl-tRNA synthetase